MSTSELRKRRITDFFNSNQNASEKRRCSLGSPSEGLKCPKTKIFDDDVMENKLLERRRPKRINKDLDKSQRILDCGQSKIGNIKCDECQMVYCVDSKEDRQRHNLHHNRFQNTELFRVSSKLMKVFWKCGHKEITNHHIFHIGSKSPTILKNQINDWMLLVNESIHYVNEDDCWKEGKRIYLCLSKELDSRLFLAGMLVVEKLSEAYTEVGNLPVKETIPHDWIVGVDRIWTHQSVRKTGIAYALLDAATMLDREMEYRGRRLRVAFSELTNDGKVFARKFIDTRYLKDENQENPLFVYH